MKAFFRSLFGRLALSYLALIILGMGIAAPLAWLSLERLYLENQTASLLAQAQLVASALSAQPPQAVSAGEPGALPYSQLSNALPGIHSRVIDPQGGAVIDLAGGAPSLEAGLDLPALAQNAAGLVTPEELLSRPEIVQAQQGQPATAIRSVAAAGGRRVLYAAVPVLAGDGQVTQIVYLATPLPDPGALQNALRWQVLGAVLAAAGLAGAAGLFLARQISRPLSDLARAARAVAGGDLQQAVPVDGAVQELETLGTAFNGMTASLRQADQAKTAFISDVSHELRTPLTVIKGTIETLQDGALDDLEARGPFLEAMSRETERLIRLVNDLLVLTRADAGALNLQPELFNLVELAEARTAYFAPLAAQNQVRLRVDAAAPCPVLADPDRIAQVLDNLLANAIRYSPAGAEVTVSLTREPGSCLCRVADHGPGIAPKDLPHIFDRFYRADTARARAQGGSGLGLAIARSLVHAHGGEIAAANRQGAGAVLTFWLPLAAETDPHLPPA